MRRIIKDREPSSLTSHRLTDGADWDGFGDRAGARLALYREQGGVCCFCQAAIGPEDTAMKIAHFEPRNPADRSPDARSQELDWKNLFGACFGSQVSGAKARKYQKDEHCDRSQGNQQIDPRLHPALRDPAGVVHYCIGDGAIKGIDKAQDGPIHLSLDRILNLNVWHLRENRRRALQGALEGMRKKGAYRGAELRKAIARYERGHAGRLPEFCDFILAYLRKRLAPIAAVGPATQKPGPRERASRGHR